VPGLPRVEGEARVICHFIVAHRTPIALAALWLFSATCSSMPPLSKDAGYYTTWAHDLMQAIAANLNKIQTKV
jgi:hypothetical protein